MTDIDYTQLPVQLFRMGVPDDHPIRSALCRLHEAEDRTELSPDKQGALIGSACLAVDREWRKLTKEVRP
ncbi:hypothetical protein [Halomonas koreensis]|uniref:Uncharacterized protein n=1 Tax=Halomonas koreensis TaxID=245385 RepID=A0ABU1G4Q4_9GAMM|nr:hypothetical protein [Halomonas koreensis]MDR5867943.1 hypothetical protein [Halomonas koreensis]